jgi:DNA-binding NtrC family response regulator
MRTEDLEASRPSALDGAGTPRVRVVASPDEAALQASFVLAPTLTVGRREGGETADASRLLVADPRVSQTHAVLRWRADEMGCEVTDSGSRNGTFVDRKRVSTAFVPIGQIVRLGDTFLEVTVSGSDPPAHPRFVGRSAALAKLIAEVERVAPSEASVLVTGETGTGKELVAHEIHAKSGRAGAFVAVNCATIPPEIAESFLFGHRKGAFTGAVSDGPSVFERADRGTLFFDEVGELRLDLQAKLLRVLESRQFTPVGAADTRVTTARFVSATNAALRAKVAAQAFRADLFARLATVEIEVPPLRRRRSDVPLLLSHFLARLAPEADYEISPNAMDALLARDWPLNVREVWALAERLRLAMPSGGRVRSADLQAVLGSAVAPEDGDPTAGGGAPTDDATSARAAPAVPERGALAEQLHAHRGNVLAVAHHYGKDRKQIYRWLAYHALDPRDFRG